MYKYVEAKKVLADKKECEKILSRLCKNLREDGISAQLMLIGSGGNHMVTQNGNEPYDLDYNLVIQKLPEQYQKNLRELRNLVMNKLNALVDGTDFSKGHDHKACITSIVKLQNGTGKSFSFDLAIVRYDKEGQVNRLIHRKEDDTYIWNTVPHSYNVKGKAREINKKGKNKNLRDEYLNLKNMYLQRGDLTHSSFVIYAEAVDHVYHQIFG